MSKVDITKYRFPFRVGRKSKRAILDADGLEVIVFPVGHEQMAELTMQLYNEYYDHCVELWSSLPYCC